MNSSRDSEANSSSGSNIEETFTCSVAPTEPENKDKVLNTKEKMKENMKKQMAEFEAKKQSFLLQKSIERSFMYIFRRREIAESAKRRTQINSPKYSRVS